MMNCIGIATNIEHIRIKNLHNNVSQHYLMKLDLQIKGQKKMREREKGEKRLIKKTTSLVHVNYKYLQNENLISQLWWFLM